MRSAIKLTKIINHGRHFPSAATLTPPQRRLQSTQQHSPLREYFVLVWDHPNTTANRNKISHSDLVPPFCTFAGECLSPHKHTTPIVQGNAFSCLARNVDEVKDKMRRSVYNTQGVWDLSSAEISPLMTVHSSDYDVGAEVGGREQREIHLVNATREFAAIRMAAGESA